LKATKQKQKPRKQRTGFYLGFNISLNYFRYVSKSILKGHLHHTDGLFAKRFFPADSLVSIFAG